MVGRPHGKHHQKAGYGREYCSYGKCRGVGFVVDECGSERHKHEDCFDYDEKADHTCQHGDINACFHSFHMAVG